MDSSDIKKWRKKLRLTQAEAGQKLDLSRAAVQYWEAGLRPVPLAVELACHELLRRWKQRPEFGPVTLLYADDPIWQEASTPCGILVLRCEQHSNNESAIQRAVWLRKNKVLVAPLIVEDDGNIIWSTPELLRECDIQKGSASRDNTNARLDVLEGDGA